MTRASKTTSTSAPLLSDQLRHAVERSGLTSYKLGKLAGIDRTVVSRFVAGRPVTLDTADAIASALRLKLTDVGRPRKT